MSRASLSEERPRDIVAIGAFALQEGCTFESLWLLGTNIFKWHKNNMAARPVWLSG